VIIAAGLLLTACAAPAPGPGAFRDPKAPIWSAAAFAPGSIAGQWRQVADYQATLNGTCQAGELTFQPQGTGLQVYGTLCLSGVATKVAGLASVTGPGRLTIPRQPEWWILWVDSGTRTLAIGTPSGQFGFVLDRGAAAADRLAAAREVFDFNGYAPATFRAF
jgi:apolipoprotein D and lipocalin family protein